MINIFQDKGSNVLTVRFGPKYIIGTIYIEGDKADTFYVNLPFSNSVVNEWVNEYLGRFQEDGRYYVSMIPVRFEKHDGQIDIYTALAEGPVVHVSDIELVGLKRTDADFIKKLAGINRGDIISASEIKKSQDNINRLDFVGLNGSPAIIPEAGFETVRVRYDLMEKQQFYFEGAGGYIPEDDGYYVWYLDLRGRNLFGRGQKAGLLADSREKHKSIFRVYYGQPLLVLGMGNILLNVQTRDYRDQFYEFAVSAGYELAVGEDLTFSTELGWKNVEPSSELLRSYRVYEVGVGANVGRMENYRGAPVSYAFQWNIKYSGRRYRQQADSISLERAIYDDSRAVFKAEVSGTAFNIMGAYLSGSFFDIESSEKPLPASEMILFGGPGTLRGYRNDQFSAQRLVLSTSEIRLFFSRNDYFYPFVDGAYFERYIAAPSGEYVKDDEVKFGYGLGLKLTSGSRDLKVEFSWGESARLSEPRLIVSLSGQF